MILTFIVPAIGKKPKQKYIGTWKMEPLTIAVLKGLTPSYIQTKFFDDRIELIDYDSDTDLVVITVETYTAKRSYKIAEQFKKHGKTVVMGGYHPTLVPEEALGFADAIITGNAEGVWEEMLKDFENHVLKKRYDGGAGYSQKAVDKSIFRGKKYLPVSLVETGRGCCHSCEFCAISAYYDCKYYRREHTWILADIEKSEHKVHFLVDDNLMADRGNALSLFEKIKPYHIKWAGQGTLSMAKDGKLLKAMKDSGCELMLIGFESLNRENLLQMNKSVNHAAGEYNELVQRIHEAGIGIYATFVFGYDYDTERSFEEALEFSKRHRFYTAAFNHLLPFPNTTLYRRLQEENRLLYDKWWLAEDYNYGEVAFQPKNMSAEQLSLLCKNARKAYAAPKTVFSRGTASMKRSSPLMWSLFWGMNLRLGEEIDEKMNVPIGENLDELPK